MAIVNLYSSGTSMWAIPLISLGNISGWTYGESYGCTNSLGNGMYVYGTTTASKPAGTPLNKIDYGTTAGVSLYANSSLISRFSLSRYGSGTQTGYSAISCRYPGVIYEPGLGIGYGSYWSYISDCYLATAVINGVERIGFYIYNENPAVNARGCFCTQNDWSDAFLSEIKIIDNDNPYWGGGYSETGGGDPQKQNWSENSDIVVPSQLPDETIYGAQAAGLLTIFTPSASQLRYLSDVIWGNGFFQFMQNLVENISDLFISFGMVPFQIDPGQTVEVTWFDFAISGQQVGTGIYLTKAANQFIEMDMGTIMLDGSDNRIFATDSVLDYSPYSRLGIYLPFIGYQELDIDECRNSPMNLKYRFDILSGICVAQITINGRTIYQFTGNCLTQLPLTSMDAQTMISNAVNIGIAAASAGATGAVASAGDALTAENLASGDITAAQAELQNSQRAMSVSNAGGSLAAATANGMMGMKPNFKKSGAIGASASLISVMQPYLFLTTPRQSMPENYNKVCGFPCNIGGTLADFTGFTVVEDIRLNDLVALSPEVEEIYQLLKKGVII